MAIELKPSPGGVIPAQARIQQRIVIDLEPSQGPGFCWRDGRSFSRFYADFLHEPVLSQLALTADTNRMLLPPPG